MTDDLTRSDTCFEPACEVEFVARRVDHRDAVHLLAAFYQEQVARYGFAESVDLASDDYAAPSGVLLVAYRHDAPVACGGCRWYDRTTATVEIKKTYVIPNARGRGIGRALLARLEAKAIELGADHAILETGIRNTGALALFASSGYRPTARYVAGRDPSINRAFRKPLTIRADRHDQNRPATVQ